MTQTLAKRAALTSDEARHLLRRLVFAATPPLEAIARGRTVEMALDALLAATARVPLPAAPEPVRNVWTNTALRLPGISDQQYDVLRAAQVTSNHREIELVRQWWLGEMISGTAPLRENLTLFFEGTFGSSIELVDVPHAIHQRNALIRRSCLGTIPALLDALVTDPAMLVQIGMDEHFKARVSDRPAKLILDHWTVGAGAYSDSDVDNLSRALTGWHLVAAPGHEPAVLPDPDAVLAARRTGLTAAFVPAQFDSRPKTILGTTDNFDARSALRLLSRHPATARRFSQRLLQHLGVEQPGDPLLTRLAATYQSTDGSIEALLRVIVQSDEFWSSTSRWALMKSPIQLAVGACRQLELTSPAPRRRSAAGYRRPARRCSTHRMAARADGLARTRG